jgi:signal transduction histidine kinase/ActR/RegA family two-component response regulator
MLWATVTHLASALLRTRWECLPESEQTALADEAQRLMLERSLFNMVPPATVLSAYLVLRPMDGITGAAVLAAMIGLGVTALVRLAVRRDRGTRPEDLRRRRANFVATELVTNASWVTAVCVAVIRHGLGVPEALLLVINAGLGSATTFALAPDLRLRQTVITGTGGAVVATLVVLATTESLVFAATGAVMLVLQLIVGQRVHERYWIGQIDHAERDLALGEVRRSHRELRRAIDAAPVGILAVREGRVVLANPEAQRLIGVAPGLLAGGSFAVVAPELAAPGPAGSERRLASGAVVELQAPAEIALEGAPATLVMVRDVSQRRELEDQLAMTDRAVALATMAAGFAHELNNPLAVVEGNTTLAVEALRRRPPDIADAELLLDMARVSCDRLRVIVADLAGLARVDDDPSPVALRPLVATAVRLAMNHLRHRASTSVALDEVPSVLAVPSQIVQVVLALLTNAGQAIPLGRADQHNVTVTLSAADGRVIIAIADDGEGIPAAALPRVFEPFFTTRAHDGIGLGLTICHAIVRRFGGELTVTSRAGAGTLARVSLPAIVESPVAVAAPPVVLSGERTARRLLVVDDEPLIGSLLRRMLKHDDVVVVESAMAALDHLSQHPVDAVLCDLMMPNVTGIELHARLREQLPDVADRMLFMSGGVFGETAQRFVDDLAPRILYKPFRRSQVEAALDDLIAEVTVV